MIRTLTALLVVMTLAASACSDDDSTGSKQLFIEATAVTSTTGPGSTAAPPASSSSTTTTPAPSYQSVVARATGESIDIYPRPAAEAVSELTLPSVTDKGSPLVFLVEQQKAVWLKVLLPVRPNGSTGWVRRADVELTQHQYRIEVRLQDFDLRVYDGPDLAFQSVVGVARDNAPTPGGRYYITELLEPPDPNTAYGRYAYGLSGFSDTFTSFAGGPGQLGIHGTNDPQSLGTAVSSGCIRMHDDDISRLVDLLPLGTPVEVSV